MSQKPTEKDNASLKKSSPDEEEESSVPTTTKQISPRSEKRSILHGENTLPITTSDDDNADDTNRSADDGAATITTTSRSVFWGHNKGLSPVPTSQPPTEEEPKTTTTSSSRSLVTVPPPPLSRALPPQSQPGAIAIQNSMATSSPSPQLPASPNVSSDLEAPPSSRSLDPSKAPSTGNLIEAEVVNYQSALGVYVEESEHLNPNQPPPPPVTTQADSFWRRSFVALVVSLVVVLVVVIVVLVVGDVGGGGDDDGNQSKNLPTLPPLPPLPTRSPAPTSLATSSPSSDSDDAATPTSSPTTATSPMPTPQTLAPTNNPTAAATSAPSTATTMPPTNNPVQASSDIQEYREEAAWEIATATMGTILGEDLNQLRDNWTPPEGGIVAVTNRLPLEINGSGLTLNSTVFGTGGPIRFVSGSYQGNLTFVAPVDESTFLSFELRNRTNPVDGFIYRDVTLGFSAPIRAFGFDYRIAEGESTEIEVEFQDLGTTWTGRPLTIGSRSFFGLVLPEAVSSVTLKVPEGPPVYFNMDNIQWTS